MKKVFKTKYRILPIYWKGSKEQCGWVIMQKLWCTPWIVMDMPCVDGEADPCDSSRIVAMPAIFDTWELAKTYLQRMMEEM